VVTQREGSGRRTGCRILRRPSQRGRSIIFLLSSVSFFLLDPFLYSETVPSAYSMADTMLRLASTSKEARALLSEPVDKRSKARDVRA
jgi:hypothetical protein